MRQRQDPYEPEKRARAVELVARGETFRAVAQALDVALTTVVRWARSAGVASARARKRAA
jgi:transposase-like protein